MSNFENPFTGLTRREYNITNLKKVLDVFPSSLQVKQLTSNQLLERLEDMIEDRDIRIEELLARLADRNAIGSDIDSINDQLNSLSDNLDLEQFVNEAAEDTELEARIESLKGQGYVQIGDTPLYVLVEDSPRENIEFNMNHTREKDGFPASDLKSPSGIKFANVSKDEDVWFMKHENWTSDLDGFYNDRRFKPNRTDNFGPTNVFRFKNYTNAHKRAYKIPKDSDASTPVTLYYDSKGDYKDAGLKRRGETNEWAGNMLIKAKVGDDNVTNVIDGTDVGRMRLWRDRT